MHKINGYCMKWDKAKGKGVAAWMKFCAWSTQG